MTQYISVIVVQAEPETCNEYSVRTQPDEVISEAGNKPGFTVLTPTVIGEDSVLSWMPLDQFIGSHRPSQGIPFSFMLEALRQGEFVRLPHWEEDIFLGLNTPVEGSDMSCPYIYMENQYGKTPWTPSAAEMFTESYEIVDKKSEIKEEKIEEVA